MKPPQCYTPITQSLLDKSAHRTAKECLHVAGGGTEETLGPNTMIFCVTYMIDISNSTENHSAKIIVIFGSGPPCKQTRQLTFGPN